MLLACCAAASAADEAWPGGPRVCEQAAQRAVDWLAPRVNEMPVGARLLLDFVRRKFALPDNLAFSLEGLSPGDRKLAAVYARLYTPHAEATPPPREAPEFIRNDLRALYCRERPLPADFAPALRRQMARGGYALTHAALACQWARDNGCIDPESPLWRRLSDDIAGAMAGVAREKGVRDEVGLEAAAFLCYMGRKALLPEEAARELRGAQRASGAFHSHASAEPGFHDTVLCLWILLEIARPDTPHVSMIPGAGAPRE